MQPNNLRLVTLIVLVQLNRLGASLSSSTVTTTSTEEDDDTFTLFDLVDTNSKDFLKRKNESEDHPIFVAAPDVILVHDDLPVSSVLGKVKAVDPTNEGRKCFYHVTESIPDIFSVDIYTGVITTKERLDTAEDAPVTIRNVTECCITISTTFHNFSDGFNGMFDLEVIYVTVKVLHGSLLDLTPGQNDAILTSLSQNTPKSVTANTITTAKSEKHDETENDSEGNETFDTLMARSDMEQSYYDNPLFISAPAIILVADDLPVSSEIGKVTAVDPTNQQRKCFYHIPYENNPFSVDKETGVIKTNTTLDDTGERGKMNISQYVLTIVTAFHNFTTKKSVYDNTSQIVFKYFEEEYVQICIKILPGAMSDQIDAYGTIITVGSGSAWNGATSWIPLPIGFAIILVVIIVVLTTVTTIAFISWRCKNKRNVPPPPPTCTQIAPEPSKI